MPGSAAAFFTGYHAPVGEHDGTLDHTYTSETLYNTRINGKRCSEAMLNAALLGTYGVPLVLVTGDSTTVAHVTAEMPWVTGVAVKDSIGRFSVNSISPAPRSDAIRAGAQARDRADCAMRSRTGSSRPIVLDLDFCYTHNADFAELIPGFERTGGRSVRFVNDDYRVVFRAYVAAFRLGAAANAHV